MAVGVFSTVTLAESAQLQELARGGVVLEMGSFWGGSTLAMAQTAAQIHSVDWHLGDEQSGWRDSLPTLWRNLQEHRALGKVVLHVGAFADVLPWFKPASFDGVFLDGCHAANAVRQDLALLEPLVIPGGWVATHDYGRFDVADVFTPWSAERGLQMYLVETLAWVRF